MKRVPMNRGATGRGATGRESTGLRTGRAARAGQYVALLAYLVFLAFPFVWLISTAFKPARELGSLHPTWIPNTPPSTTSGRRSTSSRCSRPPPTR